jgi:hypothetical protein
MAEPDATLAAPLFSFNKSDVVTLLAGPDEHELIVYESCITRNSDFFRAAMKKEWTEGQTRTIKLPEEDCIETLTHYLNYAYSQKLPTDRITAVASTGFPEGTWTTLANIYVLGERMLDQSVQHAVIKELTRLPKLTCEANKSNKSFSPNAEAISLIYDGTTAGSPARRLMVDYHVARGYESWLGAHHHAAFVLDLAKALQNKITSGASYSSFRSAVLAADDYLT